MDVRSVLLLVLTHEQQHGRVACLIQHRLTKVDCGNREVLQFFLQEDERQKKKMLTGAKRWSVSSATHSVQHIWLDKNCCIPEHRAALTPICWWIFSQGHISLSFNFIFSSLTKFFRRITCTHIAWVSNLRPADQIWYLLTFYLVPKVLF